MKTLATFLVCISLACFCSAQNGADLGLVVPTPVNLLITPTTPSIPTTTNGLPTQLQMDAAMNMLDGSSGGDYTFQCGPNWNSSNTAIATVNANGIVTAVSPGSTTVSCTLPNSLCQGINVPCAGSTVVTVLGPPTITNPQICGTPPCALPQGFGPPNAVAYSFQFACSTNNPPCTWAVIAGSIPPWSTLTSGGSLSGTPNATGTTVFTIQATDTSSANTSLQVSLNVVAGSAGSTGPPAYQGSTTSTLANNLFAGCNTNVPSALCGVAATTYSVTSNIVTINVGNSFAAGSGAGACTLGTTCGAILAVSGCQSATFLNGMIIGANSSTTGSAVVGPWFNYQYTAQTHANISATSDPTCYLQGQGWNPAVIAPFPAPGSSHCPLGNGSPGCTGTLTQADINTFAFDPMVPSGALNSLNNNCWTMLTNVSTGVTGNAQKTFGPSKSGETNDPLISLDDGSGGYFIAGVVSGRNEIFHAHIGANACGTGKPGLVMDTPLESEWWWVTPENYGGFSKGTRPGTNQAIWYTVNLSNQYSPLLQKYTLTYNPTGCSGNPCVTASPATTLYTLTNCPAWKYTTIGTGLGSTTQFGLDQSDNQVYFGLGSGGQSAPGTHMLFDIGLTSNTCQNEDTEGFSGSAVYSFQPNNSNRGTGFNAGDQVHFITSCLGVLTVTTVNTSGGVTGLSLTSGGASGCSLASNIPALASPPSTGTGLQVDITGVGTPGSFVNIWPSGSSSPTTTSVASFTIHSGNEDQSGTYGYTSGWGKSGQPPPAGPPTGCTTCDYTMWVFGTGALLEQTHPNIGGHQAVGYFKYGVAQSPFYTKVSYGDPSCTIMADCTLMYTFPTGPCIQMHSSWPSPGGTNSYPFLLTTGCSNPGVGQSTNPPNWGIPFSQAYAALDQTSVTRWFAHAYENSNNKKENFQAYDTIWTCSQDGKFCVVTGDCNSGFAGNAGCGTDNNSQPFTPMFGLMLQ